VFGIVGLAGAIKSTVAAAQESETSQARLVRQLKASGISYQDNAKQINSVVQSTANLAAVDDEKLQDALTNLVRTTGDLTKSLGLMGLVTDLSAAKHITLERSAVLVGKVAEGNTTALNRYGIVLAKNATASEALAELQKRFSGQAETYGRTSQGAMDRMRNSVENLQESIGSALAPTIAKVANSVAKFVDQIRTGTGAGGSSVTYARETSRTRSSRSSSFSVTILR
jgi:hypothetical protein